MDLETVEIDTLENLGNEIWNGDEGTQHEPQVTVDDLSLNCMPVESQPEKIEVVDENLTEEEKKIKELTAKLEEATKLLEPFAEIFRRFEYNELDAAKPIRGEKSEDVLKAVLIETTANVPLLTMSQVVKAKDFVMEQMREKNKIVLKDCKEAELASLIDF